MDGRNSEEVARTLSRPEVHDQWEAAFRTGDNSAFYEGVFDLIASLPEIPEEARWLDVGCGVGAHTLRLVNRGYEVVAVDFSEYVLEAARKRSAEAGCGDRATFRREDVLDLSFGDASFEAILCWGVLMHIPEAGKAIDELVRVLKPGGALVVSEANMRSAESRVEMGLRRLVGKMPREVRRAPEGLEFWTESDAGKLLTRRADVRWLERAFQERGLSVQRRLPGQFTELYARVPDGAARKLVHAFNRFWFSGVRLPGLAYGNILVMTK